MIELFYIGIPVVRTDGRSLVRSVYGPVITKFSRMGRLPHFLSYGAPPTRTARGAPLKTECTAWTLLYGAVNQTGSPIVFVPSGT